MTSKDTAANELNGQMEDEYGQALVELSDRFEELFGVLKSKHL